MFYGAFKKIYEATVKIPQMRTCSCNRPNIGLNVTYRSKVKKKYHRRRRQYDNMSTVRSCSTIYQTTLRCWYPLVQIHSYMHVYFCSCSICLIFCHISLSSLKGFWTSKCNVTPPNSHNSLK